MLDGDVLRDGLGVEEYVLDGVGVVDGESVGVGDKLEVWEGLGVELLDTVAEGVEVKVGNGVKEVDPIPTQAYFDRKLIQVSMCVSQEQHLL